jgi:16S rRNA (cytidine1402-2'-O)-methyltransferase
MKKGDGDGGNHDPTDFPDFAGCGGTVPAIAQDACTGEVLMLAYMDEEAFRSTVETGFAHYRSPSRGGTREKEGIASERQEVVAISIDRDRHAILLKIRPTGPAGCAGNRNCFSKRGGNGIPGAAASPDAGPIARRPSLFLVPVPLADEPLEAALPVSVFPAVRSTDFFFVENEKSAWRFLSKVRDRAGLARVILRVLDEHTNPAAVPGFFDSVPAGADAAVLSEAGLPCIADPGSPAVAEAHRRGMRVVPLVGPSSILLALAASGLNGQNFAFRGYLPAKSGERPSAISRFETVSAREGQSQIFIETPYRSAALLSDLVRTLSPGTRLCVAADLLGPGEWIRSAAVEEWRKSPSAMPGKRPAVFLFLAEHQSKRSGFDRSGARYHAC